MDLKTYIYKLVNSGEVDELNDAGYGVLILNYAGVIIYANRAFEKYLGQEPFFFVDKNYTDFVPEHSIRKSLKAWAKGKGETVLFGFENTWFNFEGKEVPMKWDLCFNNNEKEVACCVLNIEQ